MVSSPTVRGGSPEGSRSWTIHLRETRAYEVKIFDLRESPTYYTRPMSPPASEPLDIDRLADGEADVDFSVPVAELPRLRSRLDASGEVQGSVHFTREAGIAVARFALEEIQLDRFHFYAAR